mmetsp:Transcript_1049/g.1260  ORF Transcript_1049/g.1260 Transcript_1049/m.1260 type:complete len:117 (-) Transcript_1049:205-555(-)|eukprot:CAMPEP_0184016008 /NCGR_PEP_ID=MMETSP0954-20121128/6674_1 /TAXON_ID=627963 /ORGANISM="Aplanochytrium sp, Strain PBS07" /LENGTH=116 /DNA_ID=CAMNT_0026296949 /DNA_START=233 /DNA_END=583 /DNA_ORIENTATION=+
MTKNIRITYKRRHCYRTKSNKVRPVKTPGGKLVAQYVKKKAAGPKCGDCGSSLPGIAHLRPKEYKNVKKCQKSVSRAYGGSRCATCVRERIIRAFLINEQLVVKKLLSEKKKKKKN